MKTILFLFLLLILFNTSLIFAQVPADQDTINIPGGAEHAGDIEWTIMQDIDTNGARINPNRVYTLNEGQIYYQIAELKVDNPTGTLSIIGVPSKYGKEKPIILIVPTSGMPILSNEVYGSIKLVNIHYQSQMLDGTQNNELFYCGTKNKLPQSLKINNCLFEFCNIDLFDCSDEQGAIGGWPNGAKFFITNSYFRNMFYNGQWWGSRVFQCKHPIDTLWVENCTITTGGLTFLQQNELTEFAYFNHNTIVNNKKYWLLGKNYISYFVTNNIFINQNWVGEDTNIINVGASPDKFLHSTINIGPNDASTGLVVQDKYYVNGDPGKISPALSFDSMKVYVSNNINYYDTLLINNYYQSSDYVLSELGTPPSYLDWTGAGSGPWKIKNIPCEWMNDTTKALFNKYKPPYGGFVEEKTITANPETFTPGIAGKDEVTAMAQWNQNQWGDPRFEKPSMDILSSKYIYGDYSPLTVPGIENGVKKEVSPGDSGIQIGITKFTDLSENFSQSVYISSIDNLPIGSLVWNDNLINNFNSNEDWQKIQEAYNRAVNVDDKTPGTPVNYKLFQNYPNPFNPSTTIQFAIPHAGNVILRVYNILGQEVATLLNRDMKAGTHKVSFNASNISSGVYIYKLQTGPFTSARKMIFLK